MSVVKVYSFIANCINYKYKMKKMKTTKILNYASFDYLNDFHTNN